MLQDTIPIHPSDFGLLPEQALIAELNKKYANRVLHDVGLCVCTFDITEAGEGKVRYGDGFLWYKGDYIYSITYLLTGASKVIFRMVVFRPFPSEIILAKVKSVDAEGMRCTSRHNILIIMLIRLQ